MHLSPTDEYHVTNTPEPSSKRATPVAALLLVTVIAVGTLAYSFCSAGKYFPAPRAADVIPMLQLIDAQGRYAAKHGGDYACSLADLDSEPGVIDAVAAGLRKGYRYEMRSCTHDAKGHVVSYFLAADPTTQQIRTRYCSVEDGVIHFEPASRDVECTAMSPSFNPSHEN